MAIDSQAVSDYHGWGVLVNSLEKVPWHLGTKCSPCVAGGLHMGVLKLAFPRIHTPPTKSKSSAQ